MSEYTIALQALNWARAGCLVSCVRRKTSYEKVAKEHKDWKVRHYAEMGADATQELFNDILKEFDAVERTLLYMEKTLSTP